MKEKLFGAMIPDALVERLELQPSTSMNAG